jgi:carbamoyl-phosphate synthase large subunit
MVIAVTGLNAIDSPGPGVAVIRALREGLPQPLRIIGLSYETLEPGIYLNDVADKTYQIPYPAAGTEALLKRLEYIHAKENIDLIIPNFDAELFNFVKLAPTLFSMGIKTFMPSMEQIDSRDKTNLVQFGLKTGLAVPQDCSMYSAAELYGAGEQMGYPLVIKGKFYEAEVCYTLEQAQKAFYKLSAKWGLPVIAQQFIKGMELNIAVLGDGKGNAISIIPMRKLYITDKGKAWSGITLEDDSLIQLAQQFVQATHWKGGCELEIMRTPEGKPYIMEINPRFPAWIYLTAASGQNQPAALAKLATGEQLQPFTTYDVGKIFIRYSWDHIIDVSEFQEFSAKGEREY